MRDSIRTVKNFPIDGIHFRDITGLLEDPNAFKESIMSLTSACMEFNCNSIVGIESRGFIFGAPIAFDLDLPLVLARKPGKLPNATVSKAYTLEYGEAELHIQEISPIMGKIVIIDDLIATGGTALACADLIHENWKIPKKNILILSVIDLPDLNGSKLIREQGYNVKTLIDFEGA
tara:strand:- start:122 stop:649 length:528 start_codon:yes stop_codon:yes gene_type:complete